MIYEIVVQPPPLLMIFFHSKFFCTGSNVPTLLIAHSPDMSAVSPLVPLWAAFTATSSLCGFCPLSCTWFSSENWKSSSVHWDGMAHPMLPSVALLASPSWWLRRQVSVEESLSTLSSVLVQDALTISGEWGSQQGLILAFILFTSYKKEL